MRTEQNRAEPRPRRRSEGVFFGESRCEEGRGEKKKRKKKGKTGVLKTFERNSSVISERSGSAAFGVNSALSVLAVTYKAG